MPPCAFRDFNVPTALRAISRQAASRATCDQQRAKSSMSSIRSRSPQPSYIASEARLSGYKRIFRTQNPPKVLSSIDLLLQPNREEKPSAPFSPANKQANDITTSFTTSPKAYKRTPLGIDPRFLTPSDNSYYKAAELPVHEPEIYSNQPPPITNNLPDTAYSKAMHPPASEEEIRNVASAMMLLRPKNTAINLEKAYAADILLEQLVENSVHVLHGLGLSRIYETAQTQTWYECEIISQLGDRFEVYFPEKKQRKIVTLRNLILKQVTVAHDSDITMPFTISNSTHHSLEPPVLISTIPEMQHSGTFLSSSHALNSPPPTDKEEMDLLSLSTDKPAVMLPARKEPGVVILNAHGSSTESHSQPIPITLDDMAEVADFQNIDLFDETFDVQLSVPTSQPHLTIRSSSSTTMVSLESPSSITGSTEFIKDEIPIILSLSGKMDRSNLSEVTDMLADLINEIKPDYNKSLFGRRPLSHRLEPSESNDAPLSRTLMKPVDSPFDCNELYEATEQYLNGDATFECTDFLEKEQKKEHNGLDPGSIQRSEANSCEHADPMHTRNVPELCLADSDDSTVSSHFRKTSGTLKSTNFDQIFPVINPLVQTAVSASSQPASRTINMVSLLGINTHTELIDVFLECIDHFTLKDRFNMAVRFLASEVLHRKIQTHQYLSIFTTSLIIALLEIRLPQMNHGAYTIDCITDYREAQIRLNKVRFKCDTDRIQALQDLAQEKEEVYKRLAFTFQSQKLTTSSAVELCTIGIRSTQTAIHRIKTSELTCRLENRDSAAFNFQQTLADNVLDYLTHAQVTDLQIQLLQEAAVDFQSPIHWCHTYLASFLWNTSKYYLTEQNTTILDYMAQTASAHRLMMEHGIAALSNISYLNTDRTLFRLFQWAVSTIEDYIGYLTLTPDLLLLTNIPFYPKVSLDILGSIVFCEDYSNKDVKYTAMKSDPIDINKKEITLHGYIARKRLGYQFLKDGMGTPDNLQAYSVPLEVILNDTPARSLFIKVDGNVNFMQRLNFYLTNAFILLFEILLPYIQETLLEDYNQKMHKDLEKMIKAEKLNSKKQTLSEETIEKLTIQAQNALQHGYVELEKQIEISIYRLLNKVFEETVLPSWLGLVLVLLHSIDVPSKKYSYTLHGNSPWTSEALTHETEHPSSEAPHKPALEDDNASHRITAKRTKDSIHSIFGDSTLRATDLHSENFVSIPTLPGLADTCSMQSLTTPSIVTTTMSLDYLHASKVSIQQVEHHESYRQRLFSAAKFLTPSVSDFLSRLFDQSSERRSNYRSLTDIIFIIPNTEPTFENLDTDLSYFRTDLSQGSLDLVKSCLEHSLNILSTLVVQLVFETNSYGLISNISFNPSSDTIFSGFLCFIFDLVDFYSATPTFVNVLLNRRVNTQVDIVSFAVGSVKTDSNNLSVKSHHTTSETLGPKYLDDNEPFLESEKPVSRSIIGMNTTISKPALVDNPSEEPSTLHLAANREALDAFATENWSIFKRESVYSEYVKAFFDLDISNCRKISQHNSPRSHRRARSKGSGVHETNFFETADLKIPHTINRRKRHISRVASRLRNDPPTSGLKLISAAKLALTNMSIYFKILQHKLSNLYDTNLIAMRHLFDEHKTFPREIYIGSKDMGALFTLFRSKLKSLREAYNKQIGTKLGKEMEASPSTGEEDWKIPIAEMIASLEITVSPMGTVSHPSIDTSRFYLDETSNREYSLPSNHQVTPYLQLNQIDEFLFSTDPIECSSRKYEMNLRKAVSFSNGENDAPISLVFEEMLIFSRYLRQKAIVTALCHTYIPGDKPPEFLSKYIFDISNSTTVVTNLLGVIYKLFETYYVTTALPPICFYGAIKIDFSNYLSTLARQTHELYILYLSRLDDYCRLIHACGVTCIENITRNLTNTNFSSAKDLGAVYFIFKNFAIFYPEWHNYYAWFNEMAMCLENMVLDGKRAALLNERLLYYRTHGSLMLMQTFKSMENRSQSISQCYQKLMNQLLLIDNWVISVQDTLFQRIREYIKLNTYVITLCDDAPARFLQQYEIFAKNFTFPRAVRNLHDKGDLLDLTAVLKKIDSTVCLPFMRTLSECMKRKEPPTLQLFHRGVSSDGTPEFHSIDFPAAFTECEDIAHQLILLCEALIDVRKDALALNMYPYNDKSLYPTNQAILETLLEDKNISAIDAIIFHGKDVDSAKSRKIKRDKFLEQILTVGEPLKLSASTVDAILHPTSQQGSILTRLNNLLPLLFLVNKLVALYFNFMSNYELWMDCSIGRLNLSDVKSFIVQVVITATTILGTLGDGVPISDLARTLLQFITQKRSQLQLFFILKSSLYKINFMQSSEAAKNVCLNSFEAMEVVTNRLLTMSNIEPHRTAEMKQLLTIATTTVDNFLCIDPRDLHLVDFYVRDLLKRNRSKYSDETKVRVFLDIISAHEYSITKSYHIGLQKARAERMQYIQSSFLQKRLAARENKTNPNGRLEFTCHFLISRTGDFVLATTTLHAQVLELVTKSNAKNGSDTSQSTHHSIATSRNGVYSLGSKELSIITHEPRKEAVLKNHSINLDTYEDDSNDDSVRSLEPDEKLETTAALAQKEGILIYGPNRDAQINPTKCFSSGTYYESPAFGYVVHSYFCLLTHPRSTDKDKEAKQNSVNVQAQVSYPARSDSFLLRWSAGDQVHLLGLDNPVISSRITSDYSPLSMFYQTKTCPNFLIIDESAVHCYHSDFAIVGDRRGQLLLMENHVSINVPSTLFEMDMHLQYDLLGFHAPLSYTTEQRPPIPTCMSLQRLTILSDINLHIFIILCTVLREYATFDSLASHLFDLCSVSQLVSLQWRIYLLMSRCIFIISYVRAHAYKLYYYTDMKAVYLHTRNMPVILPIVHTRNITQRFLTLLYKTQTMLNTAQSSGATVSNIASRRALKDSIFTQFQDLVAFEGEILVTNIPFIQHSGELRGDSNFSDSYMLSRQYIVSAFVETIIYDNLYSPIISRKDIPTECKGAIVCSLPARIIIACSTVLSAFGFHKMLFVIYKVVSVANSRSFYIFAGVTFGMDLYTSSGRQQEYFRFPIPIMFDRLPHCFTLLTYSSLQTIFSASVSWYTQYYSDLLANNALNCSVALSILRGIPQALGVLTIMRLFHTLACELNVPNTNAQLRLDTLKAAITTLIYVLDLLSYYPIFSIPFTYMSLVHRSVCATIDRFIDPENNIEYLIPFTLDFKSLEEKHPCHYQYSSLLSSSLTKLPPNTIVSACSNNDKTQDSTPSVPDFDSITDLSRKEFKRSFQNGQMTTLLKHNKRCISQITILGRCDILSSSHLLIDTSLPIELQLSAILQETFTIARYKMFRDLLTWLSDLLADIIESYEADQRNAGTQTMASILAGNRLKAPIDPTMLPVANLFASKEFMRSILVSGGDASLFQLIEDFNAFVFHLFDDYLCTYNRDFISTTQFLRTRSTVLKKKEAFLPLCVYAGTTFVCEHTGRAFLDVAPLSRRLVTFASLPYSLILEKLFFYKQLFIISPINDGTCCNVDLFSFFHDYLPLLTGVPVIFDQACLVENDAINWSSDKRMTYSGSLLAMLALGAVVVITSPTAIECNWTIYMRIHEEAIHHDLSGQMVFLLPGLLKLCPISADNPVLFAFSESTLKILSLYGVSENSDYLIRYTTGFVDTKETSGYIHDPKLINQFNEFGAKLSQLSLNSYILSNSIFRTALKTIQSSTSLCNTLRSYMLFIIDTLRDPRARTALLVIFASLFGTHLLKETEKGKDALTVLTELVDGHAINDFNPSKSNVSVADLKVVAEFDILPTLLFPHAFCSLQYLLAPHNELRFFSEPAMLLESDKRLALEFHLSTANVQLHSLYTEFYLQFFGRDITATFPLSTSGFTSLFKLAYLSLTILTYGTPIGPIGIHIIDFPLQGVTSSILIRAIKYLISDMIVIELRFQAQCGAGSKRLNIADPITGETTTPSHPSFVEITEVSQLTDVTTGKFIFRPYTVYFFAPRLITPTRDALLFYEALFSSPRPQTTVLMLMTPCLQLLSSFTSYHVRSPHHLLNPKLLFQYQARQIKYLHTFKLSQIDISKNIDVSYSQFEAIIMNFSITRLQKLMQMKAARFFIQVSPLILTLCADAFLLSAPHDFYLLYCNFVYLCSKYYIVTCLPTINGGLEGDLQGKPHSISEIYSHSSLDFENLYSSDIKRRGNAGEYFDMSQVQSSNKEFENLTLSVVGKAFTTLPGLESELDTCADNGMAASMVSHSLRLRHVEDEPILTKKPQMKNMFRVFNANGSNVLCTVPTPNDSLQDNLLFPQMEITCNSSFFACFTYCNQNYSELIARLTLLIFGLAFSACKMRALAPSGPTSEFYRKMHAFLPQKNDVDDFYSNSQDVLFDFHERAYKQCREMMLMDGPQTAYSIFLLRYFITTTDEDSLTHEAYSSAYDESRQALSVDKYIYVRILNSILPTMQAISARSDAFLYDLLLPSFSETPMTYEGLRVVKDIISRFSTGDFESLINIMNFSTVQLYFSPVPYPKKYILNTIRHSKRLLSTTLSSYDILSELSEDSTDPLRQFVETTYYKVFPITADDLQLRNLAVCIVVMLFCRVPLVLFSLFSSTFNQLSIRAAIALFEEDTSTLLQVDKYNENMQIQAYTEESINFEPFSYSTYIVQSIFSEADVASLLIRLQTLCQCVSYSSNFYLISPCQLIVHLKVPTSLLFSATLLTLITHKVHMPDNVGVIQLVTLRNISFLIEVAQAAPKDMLGLYNLTHLTALCTDVSFARSRRDKLQSQDQHYGSYLLTKTFCFHAFGQKLENLLFSKTLHGEYNSGLLNTSWVISHYYSPLKNKVDAKNMILAAIMYQLIDKPADRQYDRYHEIYNLLYGNTSKQNQVIDLFNSQEARTFQEALCCRNFLPHSASQGVLLKQLIDILNISFLKILSNRAIYSYFMYEQTKAVRGPDQILKLRESDDTYLSFTTTKSEMSRPHSHFLSTSHSHEKLVDGAIPSRKGNLSHISSAKTCKYENKLGSSSHEVDAHTEQTNHSLIAESPRDPQSSERKSKSSLFNKTKFIPYPMVSHRATDELNVEKLPVYQSLINKEEGVKYFTKLMQLTKQDYLGLQSMELKDILAGSELSPLIIPATLFVPSGLINYNEFTFILGSLPDVISELPIDSHVNAVSEDSILLVDIAAACGLTSTELPQTLQTMGIIDRFLTTLRAAVCAAMGMPPSAAYPRKFKHIKKQSFSGMTADSELAVFPINERNVITNSYKAVLSMSPTLSIPHCYSTMTIQTQTLARHRLITRTRLLFNSGYAPYHKASYQFNFVILTIPLSLVMSCNLLPILANFLHSCSWESAWINKEDLGDFMLDFTAVSKVGLATMGALLSYLSCTLQVFLFDDYYLDPVKRRTVLAGLPPHLDVIYLHTYLNIHKDLSSILRSPLLAFRANFCIASIQSVDASLGKDSTDSSLDPSYLRLYVLACYLYDALMTQYSNQSTFFRDGCESQLEYSCDASIEANNRSLMTTYPSMRSGKNLSMQLESSSDPWTSIPDDLVSSMAPSDKLSMQLESPAVSKRSKPTSALSRSSATKIHTKTHKILDDFAAYANLNDFILLTYYIFTILQKHYATKHRVVTAFQQQSINIIGLAKKGCIQTQKDLTRVASTISNIASTTTSQENLEEQNYKESTKALHLAEKQLAIMKQEFTDAEVRIKFQREQLKNAIDGVCASVLYFGDSKLVDYLKACSDNLASHSDFLKMLLKIPTISAIVEQTTEEIPRSLSNRRIYNVLRTNVLKSCECIYSLLIEFDYNKAKLDPIDDMDGAMLDGIEKIIYTWYVETRAYQQFEAECDSKFNLKKLEERYIAQQKTVTALLDENRCYQQAFQIAEEAHKIRSSQLDLLDKELTGLKELFQAEKETISIVVKHLTTIITEERRLRQMCNLAHVHGLLIAAAVYFGVGTVSVCVDILSSAGKSSPDENCCAFCHILNLSTCQCCRCCLCLCECKYVISDTGTAFLVKTDAFYEQSICRHMKRKDQIVAHMFTILWNEFSHQRLLRYKIQTDQFMVLEFVCLLIIHKVFHRPLFVSKHAINNLSLLADCLGARDPTLAVHKIKVGNNYNAFCTLFKKALTDINTRIIVFTITCFNARLFDILVAFTSVYLMGTSATNAETTYSIYDFTVKPVKPLIQYIFILNYDLNTVDFRVQFLRPVIVNPSLLQQSVLDFPEYIIPQQTDLSLTLEDTEKNLCDATIDQSFSLYKDRILQYVICHCINNYHENLLKCRLSLVELETSLEKQLQLCIDLMFDVADSSYSSKAIQIHAQYKQYLSLLDELNELSTTNKTMLTTRAQLEADDENSLNVAIRTIMSITHYLVHLSIEWPALAYTLVHLELKPDSDELEQLNCSHRFIIQVADNLYRALPPEVFLPTVIMCLAIGELAQGKMFMADYCFLSYILESSEKISIDLREFVDLTSPFSILYGVSLSSSNQISLTSKETYCLTILKKEHPDVDFSMFSAPFSDTGTNADGNICTIRARLLIFAIQYYSNNNPIYLHDFLRAMGELFYCKLIGLLYFNIWNPPIITLKLLSNFSQSNASVNDILRIAQGASPTKITIVFTTCVVQTASALWATGLFVSSHNSLTEKPIKHGSGISLYHHVPLGCMSELMYGSVGVIDTGLSVRTFKDLYSLVKQFSTLKAIHGPDSLLVWSSRPLDQQSFLSTVTVFSRMRIRSPWVFSSLSPTLYMIQDDDAELYIHLVLTSLVICMSYPTLLSRLPFFLSYVERVIYSNQFYLRLIQPRYMHVVETLRQITKLSISENNTLENIMLNAQGFVSLLGKAGLQLFEDVFEKLTFDAQCDQDRAVLTSRFAFMMLLMLQIKLTEAPTISTLEQLLGAIGYSMPASAIHLHRIFVDSSTVQAILDLSVIRPHNFDYLFFAEGLEDKLRCVLACSSVLETNFLASARVSRPLCSNITYLILVAIAKGLGAEALYKHIVHMANASQQQLMRMVPSNLQHALVLLHDSYALIPIPIPKKKNQPDA